MTSASPQTGEASVDRVSLANRFIFLVGFVAFLLSNLRSLNQSFWIDELITAWVVRDGLPDVVERATTFQGQSPLYFLFAWGAKQIFGYYEWSLRLFSLVWNLCTIGFAYDLFRRLRDRDFAACAAGSLALMMAVTASLIEARPYALALCCFTLSLVFLVKWAESGKRSEMFCFIFAAMGGFYAHYLFAIGFPLYGAVIVYLRRKLRISKSDVVVAALTALPLAVPAAWQLYLLTGKASLYSYAPPAGFFWWIYVAFRDQSSLFVLAGAALLCSLAQRRGRKVVAISRPLLMLGLILWFYPGIAVAVVSLVSGVPIGVPRYFVYALLGESLVQAGLLCCIGSGIHRVIVFVSVVIFVVVSHLRVGIYIEDWRRALASIPSTTSQPTAVLMVSGLCETKDISWVRSPEKRDYLLSPVSYYAVAHPTLPLPYFPDHFTAQDIFSEAERGLLGRAQRIFIVGVTSRQLPVKLSSGGVPQKLLWLASDRVFQVVAVREERGMFVIELHPHNLGDDSIAMSQGS